MKKYGLSVVAFFMALALPAAAFAGDVLDQTLNGWEMPVTIQGTIMEKGVDYIVIDEARIQLVNEVRNGKTYHTSVKDMDGNVYGFDSLRVQGFAVVKGGAVIDQEKQEEHLLAREIYLPVKALNSESDIIKEGPLPW